MNVLVVVAHPDDEVLGCGGTMALHAKRGDNVQVVALTDGIGARGGDTADYRDRYESFRKSCVILGASIQRQFYYPDNKLDQVALLTLVGEVEAIVKKLSPPVIYTHHAGDLNIDHQICRRAVMTACRPLPGSNIRRIYGIEVLSSTEWGSIPFVPTRFVDISSTMALKMEALMAYDEEMRPFPHARSYETVEALARLRGASVGLPMAEAFMVLRDIETTELHPDHHSNWTAMWSKPYEPPQ